MKPFFLSASLLILTLVFCLWNADTVTRKTQALEEFVSSAQTCAESGDMSGAGKYIDKAYDYWLGEQTYFHIVMQHDALDSAESLFCRLRALGTEVNDEESDDAEFCSDAAELLSQLRLLRELEEISIKNIL